MWFGTYCVRKNVHGFCCATLQYQNWAFSEKRIVGFDPWPLHSNPKLGAATSEALGLADMPETLSWYKALGKAIVKRSRGS